MKWYIWIIIDSVLVIIYNSLKLRTLLGSSKTPNLQGMFLRGAGQNTNSASGMDFSNNDGPNLNELQDDLFKSHNHTNDFSFEYRGSTIRLKEQGKNTGDVKPYYANNIANTADIGSGNYLSRGIVLATIRNSNKETLTAEGGITLPNQITTKTGSIKNNGGIETRPVNYGVNYIIKL